MTPTINGYVELTSPQLLSDQWRELTFDLAFGHNILEDLIVPESGGGYVYRDAKSVGSSTQNRFIYWRTFNDILELVEISAEAVLDENQVRIKFANSPIIKNINVIELCDSVVIMVATLASVHKLHLPHPKTTNKSILSDLNCDVLLNTSNYYILNNQRSDSSQQPICAASWIDKNMVKCALSFPNSSISIIQFGLNHHHISLSEIKQIGIIGRIWSRMPSLLNKTANECDNAIYYCLPYHQPLTRDVILVTLCRDWKIRLFSSNTKECLLTHSIIPQASFSQSIVSHNNATTEQPIMKMLGDEIIIYLTENRPEFVFLEYSYADGEHHLAEKSVCGTPMWSKLIDFAVTEKRVWALANVDDNDSALCYTDRTAADDEGDIIDGVWDFVEVVDDSDPPHVKNLVAEIFWHNNFSINTIHKALVAVVGTPLPKKTTLESLEELAFTSIIEDNQDEAWTRFYNYCLENHHSANKNIGLFASIDESVIGLVKRNNPSFITPWLTSVDMMIQNGPYRGIEFSTGLRAIIESLNYLSAEWLDSEHSNQLEQKIFDNPSSIMDSIKQVVESQLKTRKLDMTRLNLHKNLNNNILAGIDSLCDQLDMTKQAEDYGLKILQHSTSKLRSDHNPLESNSGIAITFDLFRRLARGRMTLCRDLIIYIYLKELTNEASDKSCMDIYSSGKFRRILDSYRSYSMLVWLVDTSIKSSSNHTKPEVINFISKHFRFFKDINNDRNQESLLEQFIRQNLFMSFLVNGGASFTDAHKSNHNTISNSFYVTDIVLNLCKLLWPKSNHICFAEFLFTQQLDEHLSKYLDLSENWLKVCECDRNFIRAANSLIQNRPARSVEIFDKLWAHAKPENLIGRFINIDNITLESQSRTQNIVNPTLIHRYYDTLIQLFQIYEDYQSLVTLINQCMSLLDENADHEQQQWINCFRAKLFQYYLELDDANEAYHTMVLTSDPSLRTNCLRKFIVHHCEKQEWLDLLSYPYIDIMFDFIDILTQKAENSDLSKLNEDEFHKTSFYDLLFASYVSENEFKRAAEVMYSYAQRLAHEVPGMISVKKQSDCLLIALNSLRCLEPNDAFIVVGSLKPNENNRGGILKRSYDCESETSNVEQSNQGGGSSLVQVTTIVNCKDIEIKYELTKARQKLIENNPTGNAIALSPLKAEEVIHQLVKSCMFSAAMDLALLMKAPMEPVLEGLTDKYVFLMGTTINIDIHPELERGLSDIFTHSYSNIDTYNYVANSTSPMVEKIWRLIDYYLVTYDGISHMYSTDAFKDTFSGTTVLMKVVAVRILSAGYDIPGSLKRMYMARNVAELLRLLMVYNKLVDAADLAIEIIDRILEPSNAYALSSLFTTAGLPPVYLPTHLILSLIEILNEDATNTHNIKIANELTTRLNKFNQFLKSN